MLHTSQAPQIQESWRLHRMRLVLAMLGIGPLMKHIEPILLIADYYGEK